MAICTSKLTIPWVPASICPGHVHSSGPWYAVTGVAGTVSPQLSPAGVDATLGKFALRLEKAGVSSLTGASSGVVDCPSTMVGSKAWLGAP